MSKYQQKLVKAGKFVDIQIYDTKLGLDSIKNFEIAAAASTPGLFDDYLVEYELGQMRKYEPEQLVFLGKKLRFHAALQSKQIPKEIDKSISENIDKLIDVSDHSTENYSFHQHQFMGSVFNYAVFSPTSIQSEFKEKPKFSGRPVLLCLHGLNNDWSQWREAIWKLQDKFDIVVPDLNGFGDSAELIRYHTMANYADYVAKFMSFLGIRPSVVMGYSMGGFVTQQLLLSEDFDTNKAIIISSGSRIDPNLLTEFAKSLSRLVKEELTKTFFQAPLDLLARLNIGSIGDNSILNSIRKGVSKASPRALAEVLQHFVTDYKFPPELLNRLEIDTPVLVCYGSRDFVVTPHSTEKLSQYLSECQLFKLEREDHISIIHNLFKNPDYWNRVEKFLELN